MKKLDASRPVRIAAAGVFKWASEIMAPGIAHLIGQGVTDFYLILHVDHPGVEDELERAFGDRANLTIIRHNESNYRQAAMTNILMNMARQEGFDVFLPFDADEFCLPVDPSTTLSEALEDWVRSGNGEQMLVPMPNYLAPHDTETFRAREFERMRYRVEVKPGVTKLELTLRLFPHFKSLSRLSGIHNPHQAFVINGNHRTMRGLNELERYSPPQGEEPPVKICHVPFPSRNMTVNPAIGYRAQQTARVAFNARNNAVVSREERRRQRESAPLEASWQEYSLSEAQLRGDVLEHKLFTLEPDDTCQRILEGLIAAGFDPDDPWCRSVRSNPASTFVTRHYKDDLIFDAAVTALHTQFHRMGLLTHAAAAQLDAELPPTSATVSESMDLDSDPTDLSVAAPLRVDLIKSKNRELRRTIHRLRQELEAARKAQPPSAFARVSRALSRRLRRRGPTSD